jgi:predicted porin
MRLLVAVTAALLATTASAQTPPAEAPAAPAAPGYNFKSGADSLTIYGLLDLTVGYQDNMATNGNAIIGIKEGFFSGSRFGFQGKHVLQPGSALIFKLENEFIIPTGAMGNGLIFGRDCWAGYEGEMVGQLTFGRQNTMARDFSQNYGDAFGSGGVRMDEGGWTNNNNFKTLLNYAGSVTGSRFDNGIVWKKKAGDFVLGAGYQFGGTALSIKRNSTVQVGLAWNGGPFNVSGFFNQANQTGYLDRSYSIGGNATPVNFLRLNAGIFGYTGEQPAGAAGDRKDFGWTVSAKLMPDEAYDVELGYTSIKVKNAWSTGAAGAVTNTVNAFARVDNLVTPALSNGNRNSLYAAAFYHFDKRAEVYLAGDYTNATDTYKVAGFNGKTNQTELVAGTRFKF